MKTVRVQALTLAIILLLPNLAIAQKRKSRNGVEKTLIGYISDDNHGLKHPEGSDEVVCTLECAKHGKFVLADRENNSVYQLDDIGQSKAKEFAGKKVKVRGRLVGKTMRVITIEAA
jgi:hypothetical protein